jgi:hypothetical protein
MKMRRPLAPKSISCADQFQFACASATGQTPLRYALLGAAGAALLLGACVSDVDPTPVGGAGSAGAGSTVVGGGGSAGSGTVNNNAGSGGSGANQYTSDSSFATGMKCPAVMQALLTDFTYVGAAPVAVADAGADAGNAPAPANPPNMTGVSFGDFTNTLSGSSFVYPSDGAYPVHSDVTGNDWHMTGSIGNYSGFGVVFVGCSFVDASNYQGISFTVQGSVAGPTGNNNLTFSVGTAADDITHVWLNAVAMPTPPAMVNAGRCVPAATQYDGTCAAPSHAVPVTAERQTVRVLWADLTAGRPAATVDPKEITSLSWAFPAPAGAGTATPVTYDVDITVDDLQFIAP